MLHRVSVAIKQAQSSYFPRDFHLHIPARSCLRQTIKLWCILQDGHTIAAATACLRLTLELVSVQSLQATLGDRVHSL